MTTETDNLKEQLEKLRANSKALLNERKQEKEAHDATKVELAKAQESNALLTGELTAIRLDTPVERLIADVAVDPRVFRLLFEQDYRFALDDDRNPIITDKGGKRVLVKDKDGKESPLPFEAKALSEFLSPCGVDTPEAKRWAGMIIGSKASGSGAGGGAGGGAVNAPAFDNKPEVKPFAFGLK